MHLKNLIEWIKPLRLAPSMTGFMTSMAAYALEFNRVDLAGLFFSCDCFTAMCATMAMNNWIDRHHDLLKGYDFALKHEKAFFCYVTCLWLVEAVMVSVLFFLNWKLGMMALIRSLLGLFYSWTRLVPLLPLVAIGLVLTTGAITPAILSTTHLGFLMYSATLMLIIVGRENFKDIEDCVADSLDGWKKTVATIWSCHVARLTARVMVLIGLLILTSIPLTVLPSVGVIGALISLCFFAAGAYWIYGDVSRPKLMIDIGIAVILLTLNSSYWRLYHLPPIRSLDYGALLFCLSVSLASYVIFTASGYQLKRISRLIKAGIDDGYEVVPQRRQSSLLWPVMYGLFWLVFTICRTLGITGANLSAINPDTIRHAAIEGIALTVVLVLLVVCRVPHVRTFGRSIGGTIIERKTAGMVIGFICGLLACMGLPPWCVAVILPLVSIVRPELRPLRDLLKSYGCLFGIMTAVSILKGIPFALAHIGPTYIGIVLFYFLWNERHQLPVYIPKGWPWLASWMRTTFVEEVIGMSSEGSNA